MLLELRTYDYVPGNATRYLSLFAAEGLPLITRHLPLAGYWLTEVGALNRLQHLWVYEDLADRTARRARFMADEAWTKGFLPRGFALIARQESRLLTLDAVSPEVRETLGAADVEHAARAEGEAVLRDGWYTLDLGDIDPEGAMVSGTVVAGAGLGERLALRTSADPLSTGVAGQEILRATAFSPL